MRVGDVFMVLLFAPAVVMIYLMLFVMIRTTIRDAREEKAKKAKREKHRKAMEELIH